MTAEKRKARLKRAILEVLNDCGTHAMPEESLVTELYACASPVPTRTEILYTLRELAADNLVAGLPGTLGGGNKYTITDDGRLARHA